MLQRRGIIGAVEQVVTGQVERPGFRALVENGKQDITFEAIVLRHPDLFSPKARQLSAERLKAGRSKLPR